MLEKAKRLLDEVKGINDPMTFYRRVDELFDDFDEIADQLTDLNSFLNGPQKEKYLRACRTLSIYEASKNYISDEKIIDHANQIRKIISLKEPYSFIKKLEEFDLLLQKEIGDLLEKDA